MTSLHEVLDLEHATVRPTLLGRLMRKVANLRVALTSYSNRRQISKLMLFSDHELKDIGLTRDDVRYAMRGGRFDDPSADLTDRALMRHLNMRRNHHI